MPISNRVKAAASLTTAFLLFAAIIPLTKPALAVVTPNQFLWLRYSIAFILIFPWLIYYHKKHPPTQKNFLSVFTIETITILNLLLLYLGLKMTGALEASLLLTLRPVFVTLLSLFILHEKEEGHEWIGLSLSTAGALLIVALPFLQTQAVLSPRSSLLGIGIILLTNLVDAIVVLLIKRFYQNLHKPALTTHHITVGFALLSLILFTTNTLPSINLLTHASVLLSSLYAAVFGSIIGFTFMFYGLSKIEASEAIVFSYLKPLVFIPLSVFWLKESLHPLQIVSLLVIMLGVYLVESRKPLSFLSRKLRRSPLPRPAHSHIHS